MPFDMTPTVDTDAANVYRRLCLLRELLPHSSQDQESFASCAWSLVRNSARLRQLGVSGYWEPNEKDHALFGRSGIYIFGSMDRELKMLKLNEDIAHQARILALQGVKVDGL